MGSGATVVLCKTKVPDKIDLVNAKSRRRKGGNDLELKRSSAYLRTSASLRKVRKIGEIGIS